jgi:hypothetical protein
LQPAIVATLAAPVPDRKRMPWKCPEAPAGAVIAGTTWLGVIAAVSLYATAATLVRAPAVEAPTAATAASTARKAGARKRYGDLMFILPS